MTTPVITPHQFQYVKLPDGSYGKFDAGAPDAVIKGAISRDFPDAFKALPAGNVGTIPQQTDSAPMRFGKSALSAIGVTSSDEGKNFFQHPIDTAGKILTGNRDLGNQAYQELGKGNYGQGLSDLTYAALPFLGPILSKSGHQLASGDIAGGAGTMAGAGAQVAMGKLLPESTIAPSPEDATLALIKGRPAPTAQPQVSTPQTTPPGTGLGVRTALNTAKAAVAPVEPMQALTKAIKPGTNDSGWNQALSTAAPDLVRTINETGTPIAGIDDLASAIKTAKQGLWKEYEAKLNQGMQTDVGPLQMRMPNGQLGKVTRAPTIDGGQVADAMSDSIDQRFRTQHPEQADALDKVADTYRRPLTLQEAEDYLQSANNDLHSYYAKNKVGQKVAQGDPSISNVVAEAQALRSQLYSKLDDLTGPGAAQLKQRYGALSHIEEAVLKRQNVAARQQPDSLQETLNIAQGAAKVGKSILNANPFDAVEGAGQIAVSRWLKQRNSTDGLIKNAFEGLTGARAKYGTLPPILQTGLARGAKPVGTLALPSRSNQR